MIIRSPNQNSHSSTTKLVLGSYQSCTSCPITSTVLICQSSPHKSHKPKIDKQETTETFTISDRTSNKNCQSRYKLNKKDKSWRLHLLHCFSFLLITELLVSFDFCIMTSFDNRAIPLILTADKSEIGLSSYHPWNWRSYSKLLDVIILPYSICLLRHQ